MIQPIKVDPYEISGCPCNLGLRECQTQKAKSPQLRGLLVFLSSYYRLTPDAGSLPLNGRWRLARHVVGDAGDAVDFVDDAAADGFQQFVRTKGDRFIFPPLL